jgi:hypothetical protein
MSALPIILTSYLELPSARAFCLRSPKFYRAQNARAEKPENSRERLFERRGVSRFL